MRRKRAWSLGLQGRLVLSFMLLLMLGLEADAVLYANETDQRMSDLLGEQARQIAYGLSLASEQPLAAGQIHRLNQMGKDLLRTRDILFVIFYDDLYHPLSVAKRDLDFQPPLPQSDRQITSMLMQAQLHSSPVLGDYIEVWSPIVGHGNSQAAEKLLGYVSVGVSQIPEQAQMTRINILAAVLAGTVLLGSLPLVYLLVYGTIKPIRQLVAATDQIAAGGFDTRVEVDRADLIGTLARSFNDMARTVKQQQDDLATANRQLEEKVRQRTGQLAAANQRLAAEIGEKEAFLRAVSHDLSAPLRNINGMTSMLLGKSRDKLDEDVVRRLERIQKNVEVETDLIGQLLELSRIKTTRQKMEDVDLAALARDVADVFESDFKGKGITFNIDTPLPSLVCEKARLRQVFQNLIDNAIKYMGDGPLRQINLGCQIGAEAAEFYVEDTGMGIEPDDLNSVFLLFRRGRGAVARQVSGKGVGLASVKSIVETYGGKVWATSEVGRGTTFYFTIDARHLKAA
ncbi:MAG TPA: HAMP domain-containing sensor histidine kinase [Tepidisphaeraceae bacterium]|nr:HAMP domain-containing sensor histidine kinase [Tepidisphaeraceae bacterium]